MIRITALTGFVVLAAASAHAQGWYNYAIPGGLAPANAPSRPNNDSYSGLYLGPDGEFRSGSVHTFSMDLGDGISMGLFTTVSNSPALPAILVPGFAGGITTNYANGLYLDPAVGSPSNVSGRLSVALGGGLSMDFLGGLSRWPGNFGPGSGFENSMSTTVGTGFSMNFGHGGTLSLTGSVSRGFGPGFSARPCSSLSIAACR